MTLKRMDNVGIVVESLDAVIPFFSELGLKLEGTYHDLGLFLERVSKFPRIINVSNLKVKALEKSANGATINAECIATTFVLVEQPTGAGAPAVPGAPAAPGAPAPAAPAAKMTE